MNEKEEVFHPYGIVVWFVAILFYFYEFFLRVMPATISVNILNDLHLSLDKFAVISSAYYITYSMMQIPVGILIDRFGVRLLSTIACMVCAVGVVGFSFSANFYSAIISRLLIGLGSSFGFVSLLVLAFSWFPHRYFGFLGGLGQALGAVGPLIAGGPVIFMMKVVNDDWRLIFLWLASFGAILSICISLFIRNKPGRIADEIVFIEKKRALKTDLKTLIKIPQVWLTMAYTGCVYVSLPLLGAYWGDLYLQARGFSKESSGFLVSMIWIGLAIGSPLFGRISDKLKRRKPVLAGLGFLGFAASLVFLFMPIQNEWVLSAVLIFLGIATGGQSLAFALIIEHVPSELKATAMGANNTAVMLFAALLPPLATLVIQSNLGGGHTVVPQDFVSGFLLMPIAYGISGLIGLFGIKETFCRSQQKIHTL